MSHQFPPPGSSEGPFDHRLGTHDGFSQPDPRRTQSFQRRTGRLGIAGFLWGGIGLVLAGVALLVAAIKVWINMAPRKELSSNFASYNNGDWEIAGYLMTGAGVLFLVVGLQFIAVSVIAKAVQVGNRSNLY